MGEPGMIGSTCFAYTEDGRLAELLRRSAISPAAWREAAPAEAGRLFQEVWL